MQDSSSNKLIGVVLCGGKSVRMGSDKGLLFVNNQTWFERSFELLSRIFSDVVISVNANQFPAYKKVQPSFEYVVDSVHLVEGPLTGILSVNEKFPGRDIFVLACDIVNMEDCVIQNLVSLYILDAEKDFYFYRNDFFLETLCGIYTSTGMDKIRKKLISDSNKNFAIHKLIENSNSLFYSVDPKMKKYFVNFNTANEIGILE